MRTLNQSSGGATGQWWLVFFAAAIACSHPRVPVPPLPAPLSAEVDSASRIPCNLIIESAAAAGKRVYRKSEVDSSAELVLVNHRGPEYPNERTEAVPATVTVQLVIDSSGVADLSTFRPVETGLPEFVFSVREFLRTATYKPARVGGHHVAECALQTFQFVPTYYHRAGEH